MIGLYSPLQKTEYPAIWLYIHWLKTCWCFLQIQNGPFSQTFLVVFYFKIDHYLVIVSQQTTAQDPYNEPLKAMEVCTVCGALLVVGDAQQRVDEHIMGKQHSGYARIRAYVEGKRMVRTSTSNYIHVLKNIWFMLQIYFLC